MPTGSQPQSLEKFNKNKKQVLENVPNLKSDVAARCTCHGETSHFFNFFFFCTANQMTRFLYEMQHWFEMG